MKRLLILAGLLRLLVIPGVSWARGGGGCLEEGTPVWTPKGLVPIERVAVGTAVWSLAAGRFQEATVQAVTRVRAEEYLEIAAGDVRLRVTPEHPVQVAQGVYRQAGRLGQGGTVFQVRDGNPVAVTIRSLHRLGARQPAYNLLVSPGGTFVAGNLLLHNKGCFLPESPILRADGTEVLISAVKPGDSLWAFKPDGHLVTTHVRSVLRLEVEEYIRMKTDRVTLRVTAEHPFYVGRGTFKTVEALKPGDIVLAYDGQWLAEQRILSLERVRERVPVYNLQTDQPHTFFASGVAVHNKGGGCFPAGTGIAIPNGKRSIEELASGDVVLSIDPEGRSVPTRVKTIFVSKSPLLKVKTSRGALRTTGDHPIGVGEGRFRPAGELRSGDRVTRWEGGRLIDVKVRRVGAFAGEGLVFNLEVEGPHTFIAEGMVVHNKGAGVPVGRGPVVLPGEAGIRPHGAPAAAGPVYPAHGPAPGAGPQPRDQSDRRPAVGTDRPGECPLHGAGGSAGVHRPDHRRGPGLLPG